MHLNLFKHTSKCFIEETQLLLVLSDSKARCAWGALLNGIGQMRDGGA